MGQSSTLWFQRSQAISSQLFSPVFDAAALRDGTILLTILALTGGSTAQVTAEQSLDPNECAAGRACNGTIPGPFPYPFCN